MKARALTVSVAAAALVAAVALVPPLRSAWLAFFGALRIERPQAVGVNIPSFTGATANRQLQNMVAAMAADTASPTLDEADRAATVATAGALIGFAARLPRARKDAPTLTVVGAHDVTMTVRRSQLATILAQAGVHATVPASLDGARVAIRTPRSLRAQYGHCPQPAPATLQGQLQGPPPATPDNSDCVVLAEGPATTVDAPAGLDLEQLVDVALELSGLSPEQSQAFRAALDWKAALGLAVPRFVRSFQTVDVGGAKGVLLGTAFRRGPTWELIWVGDGMVFSLVGYGNSGDAVPLAVSIAAGSAGR